MQSFYYCFGQKKKLLDGKRVFVVLGDRLSK